MIKGDTTAEVIEEITNRLAQGYCVKLYPNGNSMRPMLHGGRDQVILAAPEHPLQKGDIILFRFGRRQYLLHRIIEIRDNELRCQGDGQASVEWPVKTIDVVGIVKAFIRKGRYYEITDRRYAMYRKALPLIHISRNAIAILKKVYRRLKRIR